MRLKTSPFASIFNFSWKSHGTPEEFVKSAASLLNFVLKEMKRALQRDEEAVFPLGKPVKMKRHFSKWWNPEGQNWILRGSQGDAGWKRRGKKPGPRRLDVESLGAKVPQRNSWFRPEPRRRRANYNT